MYNYPQEPRSYPQEPRFAARSPRDDNSHDDDYGRPFRDPASDSEDNPSQNSRHRSPFRGWQQEPNYSRNFSSNYSQDANPDRLYDRLEHSSQNVPPYRSSRGQHRNAAWPRNEDRGNYSSIANYDHEHGREYDPEERNYPGRARRYFDDEARAANRFAQPQSGHRGAITDPRNAGNYNYAEPKYYGDDSGYGRDLNYAQNYSPNHLPNYSPSYSQGYDRWQSSGDVQGWQERGDAQVGAFGIQSHRGKGPRGYTRSDERIKEDVCERLSAHHYIDASAITVEVKDGVVTLEGSVDDRWQKYQAEDLIDATSGVKNVDNRLMVNRAGPTEARNESIDKSKTATPTNVRPQ